MARTDGVGVNPWTEAMRRYRRWFGWTGWEHGYLRLHSRRFVTYPRWIDTVQHTATTVILRLRGRCPQCRMKVAHKMDCSYR